MEILNATVRTKCDLVTPKFSCSELSHWCIVSSGLLHGMDFVCFQVAPKRLHGFASRGPKGPPGQAWVPREGRPWINLRYRFLCVLFRIKCIMSWLGNLLSNWTSHRRESWDLEVAVVSRGVVQSCNLDWWYTFMKNNIKCPNIEGGVTIDFHTSSRCF